MNISSKDVLIRMLPTPNPYALKFVLNVPLKNRGRASFYSKLDCSELPLFHSLFDINGVKQVFVFQNQMTLSHEGLLSEEEIERQVTAVIGTRLSQHDPDFLSVEDQPQVPSSSKKDRDQKVSPEMLKVERILDRTIRPGLQADGGDLELISVQNNEVKIAYQGACGGCPSAMMGTLEAIENILRQETGESDLKVIPV